MTGPEDEPDLPDDTEMPAADEDPDADAAIELPIEKGDFNSQPGA